MARLRVPHSAKQKETCSTDGSGEPECSAYSSVAVAFPAEDTYRTTCPAPGLHLGVSITSSVFSRGYAVFTGLSMASNLRPYSPGAVLPGTHPLFRVGLCLIGIRAPS